VSEAQPTVTAFADALKKGLGRAMILLRQAPDDPVMLAELLHACRVSLTFDAQCEARRGPYLHRLIQVTGRSLGF